MRKAKKAEPEFNSSQSGREMLEKLWQQNRELKHIEKVADIAAGKYDGPDVPHIMNAFRKGELPPTIDGVEVDRSAKSDATQVTQFAEKSPLKDINPISTVQNCAELCTSEEQLCKSAQLVESAQSEAKDSEAGDAFVALSPRQKLAIDQLIAGVNVSAVADSIGIHRNTIHHWKTCNPLFMAELARRRNEIMRAAADRLRQSMMKALGVLDSALGSCFTSLDTSMKFISKLKLHDMVMAPEPESYEECADQIIRRQLALTGNDPTKPIDPATRDQLLAKYREQAQTGGSTQS